MIRTIVLVALMLMLASPAAMALRCGNRVVSDGDRDFQIRQRCGDPYWTETWIGVDVVGRYSALETQQEVEWSVWYYNFGPRALIQRLVFVDGNLQFSESLGYGVREIGDSCRANMNFTGLSSGELVAKCGQPAHRRASNDGLVYRPAPGLENWRQQRREEWTYDFGSNQMLRVLHLINGKVESAQNLSR
jgi:hypothetical protein